MLSKRDKAGVRKAGIEANLIDWPESLGNKGKVRTSIARPTIT